MARKEAEVPTLFFLRAFEQLCSAYNNEYEPETTFPKAPKVKTQKKTDNDLRKCTFQSKIADVRLRKERVQIEEARVKVSEDINKLIEEFRSDSTEQKDVSEAFKREIAVRSEVPLYIRNELKDQEAEQLKSKKSRAPMNMSQIRKEFTERLKRSEELGKTRALNRKQKMAAAIRESDSLRRNGSSKPQKNLHNYYAVSDTESSVKGYYEKY